MTDPKPDRIVTDNSVINQLLCSSALEGTSNTTECSCQVMSFAKVEVSNPTETCISQLVCPYPLEEDITLLENPTNALYMLIIL